MAPSNGSTATLTRRALPPRTLTTCVRTCAFVAFSRLALACDCLHVAGSVSARPRRKADPQSSCAAGQGQLSGATVNRRFRPQAGTCDWLLPSGSINSRLDTVLLGGLVCSPCRDRPAGSTRPQTAMTSSWSYTASSCQLGAGIKSWLCCVQGTWLAYTT
jgi:hypothetical protein